jgi:hypothetical protein
MVTIPMAANNAISYISRIRNVYFGSFYADATALGIEGDLPRVIDKKIDTFEGRRQTRQSRDEEIDNFVSIHKKSSWSGMIIAAKIVYFLSIPPQKRLFPVQFSPAAPSHHENLTLTFPLHRVEYRSILCSTTHENLLIMILVYI